MWCDENEIYMASSSCVWKHKVWIRFSVVDEKNKMMVERKGVGKSMDDTFAENRILYSGHENPIHYKRLDNIKFEGARSQPGKTQPGRPTTKGITRRQLH